MKSQETINHHGPTAIHATFTVHLLCTLQSVESTLLVVSDILPLSSSSWPGPRIKSSENQINEQDRALVPPTWLCDLGQASSPPQRKGVSLDSPTPVAQPPDRILVHTCKRDLHFKTKSSRPSRCQNLQGSSLLSLLTAPQQAGPTDSGISQVLFHGFGPAPRYLSWLGQAFEGRVHPPSQATWR